MVEINKSLIIPCKDEGPEFVTVLKRFINYIKNDTEVVVVVDSEKDSTISEIKKSDLDINLLVNLTEMALPMLFALVLIILKVTLYA